MDLLTDHTFVCCLATVVESLWQVSVGIRGNGIPWYSIRFYRSSFATGECASFRHEFGLSLRINEPRI